MTDDFDATDWANKLETGIEAVLLLEIKDPTKIIHEAVDSLYEMLDQNDAACQHAIDRIGNEDHRQIALDHLKSRLVSRYAGIMPADFLNPPDTSNFANLIPDFDEKTFRLWGHVGKNIAELSKAVAGLRDDIAQQILDRAQSPNFANEYQEWLDAENQKLFPSDDDEERKPNFDKRISAAIDNGVAGFIVFALVIAALVSPLLSMCASE